MDLLHAWGSNSRACRVGLSGRGQGGGGGSSSTCAPLCFASWPSFLGRGQAGQASESLVREPCLGPRTRSSPPSFSVEVSPPSYPRTASTEVLRPVGPTPLDLPNEPKPLHRARVAQLDDDSTKVPNKEASPKTRQAWGLSSSMSRRRNFLRWQPRKHEPMSQSGFRRDLNLRNNVVNEDNQAA